MRKLWTVLLMALCLGAVALAAGIDGKWVAEQKMQGRGGQERTVINTFDLKSSGGTLTGSMSVDFGMGEPRTSKIEDGKIDGNSVSFTTTMETPRGSMKSTWSGTLDGDSLKLTSKMEGSDRPPREVTAKRK